MNQWEEQSTDHPHTTLSDKLGGMLGGGDKVCIIMVGGVHCMSRPPLYNSQLVVSQE